MKILRRIVVLVLIVLFLSTNLCYGQSAGMQYLAKGVDYAAQGKFKEAKEEFEKALKAYPLNLSIKENLKVVEDVIDKKIESKAAIHLFRGGDYILKGQMDAGIDEYNKALEINPNLAMAYRFRGFAYARKRLYDKAITDYTKALEINPRLTSAYYNRGLAYQINGQYEKAISDFNKAIELNPRLAEAYYNLAIVCFNKGEYDKAWEYVHNAQILGYQVHPGFLKALREASGRQK